MKRISFALLMIFLFACNKQSADSVYDSHLFEKLADHTWIFDSSRRVNADGTDSVRYASTDTIEQTTFSSQLYITKHFIDTTFIDSTVYQIIYDNPNKIYYYPSGGLVVPSQYFTIDTVNERSLVLSNEGTLANTSSHLFYHAQ